MKKISIIILNYNNYSDTCECIDSILKLPKNAYSKEIIVVDNNSNDESGQKIYNKYKHDIVYLQSKKNIGYAAGNNIGIDHAINHGSDYICILNNDTIAEMDFFLPCINILNNENDIAFVTPVVKEYTSDLVQSTGGDIIISKGLVTVNNNGKCITDLESVIECDYIGGACMVLKADLIKEIGMIPEAYFLFFEETEWCYHAKKKGYRNVCITDVAIRHKGSASIDTIQGLHSYLMERNRVVFLKRNVSKVKCFKAIIYLIIKYMYWGMRKNKKYFAYLLYMWDGINNKVNLKKYPFIYIKESR